MIFVGFACLSYQNFVSIEGCDQWMGFCGAIETMIRNDKMQFQEGMDTSKSFDECGNIQFIWL